MALPTFLGLTDVLIEISELILHFKSVKLYQIKLNYVMETLALDSLTLSCQWSPSTPVENIIKTLVF